MVLVSDYEAEITVSFHLGSYIMSQLSCRNYIRFIIFSLQLYVRLQRVQNNYVLITTLLAACAVESRPTLHYPAIGCDRGTSGRILEL